MFNIHMDSGYTHMQWVVLKIFGVKTMLLWIHVSADLFFSWMYDCQQCM